jgi:hypothetical protein
MSQPLWTLSVDLQAKRPCRLHWTATRTDLNSTFKKLYGG